jgi:hypothetical protein
MCFNNITNEWLEKNNFENNIAYIYLGGTKYITVLIEEVNEGHNALSQYKEVNIFIKAKVKAIIKKNILKMKFLIIPTFKIIENIKIIDIKTSLYSKDFYSEFSPSGFLDIENIFPSLHELKKHTGTFKVEHETTNYLKNNFTGIDLYELSDKKNYVI